MNPRLLLRLKTPLIRFKGIPIRFDKYPAEAHEEMRLYRAGKIAGEPAYDWPPDRSINAPQYGRRR